MRKLFLFLLNARRGTALRSGAQGGAIEFVAGGNIEFVGGGDIHFVG